MTSTTQEVTAEQIALALGWANVNGRWMPPELVKLARDEGENIILIPQMPKYLEDSPEGWSTLREFEQACAERGWHWMGYALPDGRRNCSIQTYDGEEYQSLVPPSYAAHFNAAAWTAWYRAVQAQEQLADG